MQMELIQKAIEFDRQLENVLHDLIPVQNILMAKFMPSDLSISTITMSCQPKHTDKTKIDVMDFRMYLEKENKIPEKYMIKEPKKGKRAFKNCVIFSVVQPNGKVAIKVFSNMSLHVTGVKCVKDLMDITKPLWDALALYTTIDGFSMANFQVQMINSNFSLNKVLDLQKLKQLIETSYCHSVVHNKETHPGVVVKFQNEHSSKKVTILIFTSGNVIITGAQNATDLYQAYCFITNIIEDNLEKIEYDGDYIPLKSRKRKGEEKKRPGRKKKSEAAGFYDSLLL